MSWDVDDDRRVWGEEKQQVRSPALPFTPPDCYSDCYKAIATNLSHRKPLQDFDLEERARGFEPLTSSLGSWHSTTELRPLLGENNGPYTQAIRYRIRVASALACP